MATNELLKKSIESKSLAPQQHSLESLLANTNVRKRFDEMLGTKSAGFLSSIISLYNTKKEMQGIEPQSILAAAAVAASLDLPVNPSLGFAHIVPYSGKAQFQIGWKGFVQLAIRSGQYKTMNTAVLYEGELKSWNRVTCEIEIDLEGKISDKVIGYVAFFRLTNGFEKYLYMTAEQMERHGKRYSQSYNSQYSKWKQDPESMGLKTVIKQLLSKYGILSLDMQRAIQSDQSVVVETKSGDVEFHYEDNPTNTGAITTAELPAAVVDTEKEPDPSKTLTAGGDEIPFGG